MANHAGLKKVIKSVRGKKGTVRRSYWVKSSLRSDTGSRKRMGAKEVLKTHGLTMAAHGFGMGFAGGLGFVGGASVGERMGRQRAAKQGLQRDATHKKSTTWGLNAGLAGSVTAAGLSAAVMRRSKRVQTAFHDVSNHSTDWGQAAGIIAHNASLPFGKVAGVLTGLHLHQANRKYQWRKGRA